LIKLFILDASRSPDLMTGALAEGRKMEERTARLTLLIDPRKKAIFEALCAKEDVTPSQKVRQFIREYIEQKLGPEWLEDAAPPGGKNKRSK
jgi:hypothetical protein